MCGRVFEEVSEIKLNPLKGRACESTAVDNAAPLQCPPLPVMTLDDSIRTVEPMRWGLHSVMGQEHEGWLQRIQQTSFSPSQSGTRFIRIISCPYGALSSMI
jgi:hypothetical protein